MKPGNRQVTVDMVPIHTKHFALKDGRKVVIKYAFLPHKQEGILF